ncbi:competence/damage-inducible protein CinA [Klebsiella pneumoniae subsp. rhinoscleromatis]|nr:competence/damage-inducible protein CinA [Klebsiella pneumoniae subsp. rhinoscleromatis]
MAESNRKQAEIPASAEMINNPGRYGLWALPSSSTAA